MIYLFKHIVVRTKREVNDIYKSLFGKDFYDMTDYNGDEIISEHDKCVKIYDDSFELHIRDGRDKIKVFGIKMYEYRVERWYEDNKEHELIEGTDEVLDPEKYAAYCKDSGDEIRIYDNRSDVLVDSYRYELPEISSIADKIESALKQEQFKKSYTQTR